MDFFDLFNEQHTKKTAKADEAGRPADLAKGKNDATDVNSDRFIQGLNPEQKAAVLHDEGPLLILAGAGSGKTRVITHRIAYLISARKVNPWQILAITFTNKAAGEMKERVAELIGDVAKQMWIGTFHSMFARILRKHADAIGFTSSYSIIDSDDQKKLVRDILKELNIDEKQLAANAVHSAISNAKNALIGPQEFLKQSGGGYYNERISKIYKLYQERLQRSNSMDFDDILFYTVSLFNLHPDILALYQERFRYIMVDEYQDTNGAQYQIIKKLAAAHENICVVGDDDQSIYSFRGANIRNILDFEADYRHCTVIKLEQNYRSTQTVLNAANAVIANNKGRKAKKLWTSLAKGEPISFVQVQDNFSEARFIADEINRRVKRGDLNFSNVAILYRANAVSRSIEQGLREQGIPYRIYGGLRFYDRKEIKDVLAYLRLIVTPTDDLSFDRVVNTPKRGVGQQTLLALTDIASRERTSMLDVASRANEYPELSRAARNLVGFASMIEQFRKLMQEDDISLGNFIELIENESGLVQEVLEQREKEQNREVTVDRVENLKELLSDAFEFSEHYTPPLDIDDLSAFQNMDAVLSDEAVPSVAAEDENSSLNAHISLARLVEAFLEHATLSTSADMNEDDDNFVRLMTIHSAKGLEFDLVFLASTEEGIFPSYRSVADESQLEEERRLAYVAITRAKRKLYITTARTRMLYGQTQNFMPSRFIQEIPEEYLEEIGGSSRGDRYAFGSRHSEMPVQRSSTQSKGVGARPSTNESLLQRDARAARKNISSGMDILRSGGKQSAKDATLEAGILQPHEIKKGDKVRHDSFGLGEVLQVEPVAGDALVAIQFAGGMKRLMAKYAKLKKG